MYYRVHYKTTSLLYYRKPRILGHVFHNICNNNENIHFEYKVRGSIKYKWLNHDSISNYNALSLLHLYRYFTHVP